MGTLLGGSYHRRNKAPDRYVWTCVAIVAFFLGAVLGGLWVASHVTEIECMTRMAVNSERVYYDCWEAGADNGDR